MSRKQVDFYNTMAKTIEDYNDLRLGWNMSGDRYVFVDINTGRIVLNVDLWQAFDELRTQLGAGAIKDLVSP